jgi:hypothetical protein
MPLDEIAKVVQETSRNLLQVSVPPVRYWLLTDTMGVGPDNPLVKRTIEECKTYPPRIRLLKAMRSDGTWPISKPRKAEEDAGPGPPIGWTFVTMLRNLQLLEDMVTDAREGYIQASLEKILSWQEEEGYILGPKHDIFPLPNTNGYAVRNLFIYGMEDDPRVTKLANWILSQQRHDGGWVIPYLEDVKYLPEYRHMRTGDFLELVRKGQTPESDPKEFKEIPSCIWSTMMVVRGLARSSKYRRRPELRTGADFFLDRFFKKNWHEAYYHTEANWTRLRYPPFPGDGLSALYTLSILGYGPSDKRMEKPIRWLLDTRHSDGFWWQSDRPYAQKDQWITGLAVDVLNRYAKNK